MSNMSYCRFQNTLRDLSDCQNALEEMFGGVHDVLSVEELRAAKALVQACCDIAVLVGDQVGHDVDLSDVESNIDTALDEANGGAHQ